MIEVKKIYKIIERVNTQGCLPQYPQQRERASLGLITFNIMKTEREK